VTDPVRIGLLGRGTVGDAFHRLLGERADAIEAVAGRRPEVAGVLRRSEGDFDAVLEASEIVVELIGGTEPARDYVLRALRAGRHVVTANKQLIAQFGDELFDAARESGVQLRFEAAVAGVVPVIRVIQESLAATEINKVFGIVNGTTNFILTRMVAAGDTYAAALHEAQELGYAEADPTEDVTGADAAAKIAILASIAFHTRVRTDEVDHVGIDGLDLVDVRHASALGYQVKLIASAMQVGDAVCARVHPCLLDADHPLASVQGAFNAVMLRGSSIREVILEGPGAGGEETATAVIGDLLAVIGTSGTGFLQHDGYYRELHRLPLDELRSPFYLRFEVDDEPGVLAQVAQALAAEGVSVAQVVQHSGRGVHIVILTHTAREGSVRSAARAVAGLGFSRSAPVALPVLVRSA
jgi:homoserine dehydrogenase